MLFSIVSNVISVSSCKFQVTRFQKIWKIWQWPGPGSWRGGKQPGRWSPGGWRSCGWRGPISSTSRLWFRALWHLGGVGDSWPDAKDFALLVRMQKVRIFVCWTPICRFSLSLSAVLLCQFSCENHQCLIRIRLDWKCSHVQINSKRSLLLQFRNIIIIIIITTALLPTFLTFCPHISQRHVQWILVIY